MQEVDVQLSELGTGDTETTGIHTKEDDHWDATTDWDTEVEVPFGLVEYVDDNVKVLLQKDIEELGIRPHGTSHWSRTAEVHGTVNGDPVSYFLKVTRNRFGKKMVRGAFEGSKSIYTACPDLCPPPIAWGQYKSDPKTYFVLSQFVDMVEDLPDMHAFTRRLAQMHTTATAPDGKYGFHVQVMCALLPIYVAKSESWEQFYTNYMQHLFAAERRAQGDPSAEMERLTRSLFERVIPRLIRPLETGGREIQPSLVHGDLWDGNAGLNAETDDPLIFDPSCFYGHNEFDLGPWRCPRHKTGRPYIEEYHKSLAKSAPEEDHEGRMLLYFLAFDTRASACWVGRHEFRDSMIAVMTELNQLYPGTYEEWATSKGETIYSMKGTTFLTAEPDEEVSKLKEQVTESKEEGTEDVTEPVEVVTKGKEDKSEPKEKTSQPEKQAAEPREEDWKAKNMEALMYNAHLDVTI